MPIARLLIHPASLVSARASLSLRAIGCAVLALGLIFSPITNAAGVEDGEQKVRVAASDRYEAGRVHRFVLGGGYRDLWAAEIELPLLDLAREGNGLVPTRRFGGLQTAVLGFKGADGRSYSFRGTDKDPSAVLDPILRNTIVQTIVQDQMAAQHPGGPPVAGVLTEAAGVLTVHERMVVMPNDPRLGEFREEFAGMVGTFFEYPQPSAPGREGFAGATEILDHDELYERLEADHEDSVDVEAFLRARLMDLFLGDFDRHRKQWRWAKLPGETRWQPLPEDRDQAFVRYDGVGQKIMKVYIPILQSYDAEYPFMKGLTLHGWEQDRWLLPSLEWSIWKSVAEDVQRRLTDAQLERALAELPPEFAALDRERLLRDMQGRRARLVEAARSFYDHLVREVDVQTSNASDDVSVLHDSEGGVTVEVRALGDEGSAEELLFSRRFLPDETREVRIYLRDGDDRVRIGGQNSKIRVRLVAGEFGSKRIDDRSSGRALVYDSHHTAEVLEGRRTRVVRKPYTPPPSESGFVDVENVPPRDWGSDTVPLPEFGYEADVGPYLGAVASHTRYGFRKHPWSSKHALAVGWAFEANAPRVRYRGRFRPENSRLVGGLDLEYSGIEVLRFYGFGNESRDRGNDRFFRVRNQQYRALSSVSIPISDERLRLRTGPFIKFSRTNNGARLIDVINPYGNHDFGLIGLEANLQFDTRKSVETTLHNLELPFHENPAAGYPTSGLLVDLTGRFSPPVWDVNDPYGTIEGSVSGYVSAGSNDWITLGLRAGGATTIGPTPYFDYAYVGGGRFFSGTSRNRGFRTRRFAGRSAVFGNADVRVVLGRIKIVVPGDIGVQAFADIGRAFIGDENSDEWHPSGGGGVWFSPLVRTNTISLSVASSVEEVLAYLRVGFHY